MFYIFRNYEVADLSSCPEIVKELINVLTSECMGLCLSNMTGLSLHPSIPKSIENDNHDEEEEYFDFGEDEDDDVNENDQDDHDSENNDEEAQENEEKEEEHFKRKNENDGDVPCSSKLTFENDASNLSKKLKTDSNEQENEDHTKACSSSKDQNNNIATNEPREMSKCYFEIRRWKQGMYTLITDDDSEIKTKALDLMVFFACKSWSIECGGHVTYIARDEDNEVRVLFYIIFILII